MTTKAQWVLVLVLLLVPVLLLLPVLLLVPVLLIVLRVVLLMESAWVLLGTARARNRQAPRGE